MGLGISYDRWKSRNHDRIADVILACGPETALKTEFIETLHDEADNDPELVNIYADETTPEDLTQELRGKGLFNETKWVVLKRLDQKKTGGGRQLKRYQEVIEDFAEDPEPGTRLILMDADHPYKKSRQVGSVAGSIEGADGWVVVFWEPFDKSIRQDVRQRFTEGGLDVDPPAIQTLLKKTQGKYSRIMAEVDKLIDAVQGSVEVSDVEQLVTREEASDGFQSLKSNFTRGNVADLMRDFDDFWRRNESPPRVIHVLYEFLDDLRTINQLTRQGRSLEDALNELGRPTSQGVKKLYRSGLQWVKKGFPRTFYRNAYETEKNSKYARDGLEKRAIELFALTLLSYPATR